MHTNSIVRIDNLDVVPVKGVPAEHCHWPGVVTLRVQALNDYISYVLQIAVNEVEGLFRYFTETKE